MKKPFKLVTQALTGFATIATLACGKLMSATVSATSIEDGVKATYVEGMPTDLIGDQGFISKVTSWILIAVGTISVIMLIYGGFRYVISGGDAKKVTDAKNTILYAIIGLIICLLSYAIIRFVIYAVTGSSTVNPLS